MRERFPDEPASALENSVTFSLSHSLADQGIETSATIHPNLTSEELTAAALERSEGRRAKDGPLVVETGKHTGRSAKDKFIVRNAETEDTVWWDNNASMTPAHFAALKEDFLKAVADKGELFVADLFGGSQPEHGQRPRDQRAGVAQPVHPYAAGTSDRSRARRFRARIHHHRPAQLPGRPRTPRHAQRDRDRGQSRES